MRIALVLAAALVLTGASWIDPHAKAREAADFYEKGDFDAATQKYNEALTDDPDSSLLQYNRGASIYRQGQYEEAATAFGRVPAAEPAGPADRAGAAEIAYNIANAKYRLGAAAADAEPEKALGLYAEALAAYRRAMGANPDDVDAKFNHELVTKKLEELKQKLEEQQKQQQEHQQQDEQEQEQQQQDQQQADEQEQQPQQQDPQQREQPQDAQDHERNQQQDQQQQDASEQDEQRQQEDQQAQQSQDAEQAQADPQQQPASAGVSGERREGEMSEREAQALLDAARDQEVRPDEIIERMQGAAVLEPSQDW